MIRSRPIAGRHLGWDSADLASKPYARFLDPDIRPLPDPIRHALDRGPLPEPLLPTLDTAPRSLFGQTPAIENGFALTADGAMVVAARTDLPGVTPAMIDWWFGWHGDSPERYKLWHPLAHVHAAWLSPPAPGSQGRARYVGATSIVDEYIGSALLRAAMRFLPPAGLGFTEASLDDAEQATIVCARTGLADVPIDVGYLVHHVRRTTGGSEMRSRFFIGGRYAAGRNSALGTVMARAARVFMRPTEADARALLVHCAEEMQHLAQFLPALYAQCRRDGQT
jgi:DAPG hydrolase PhiG domain